MIGHQRGTQSMLIIDSVVMVNGKRYRVYDEYGRDYISGEMTYQLRALDGSGALCGWYASDVQK
ncbi:hypothetical protein BGM09_10295 [Streptomyces sp. CBMA29]|nr:hypothetical protein [Streptomyces sp. CBMA29]